MSVAGKIAATNEVEEGALLGLTVKLKEHHRKFLQRFHRSADYWEYWDESYWNPGPFSNRNYNNMFAALLSTGLSFVYICIYLWLKGTNALRLAQDETLFRSPPKLDFDLCHIHILNILSCICLAAATFFFEGATQRGIIIGWVISRSLLWMNSVRNMSLFLHRPHANILYNPANPEWRWHFASDHMSYYLTAAYWTFHLISWVYEWTIVIVFYYFITLKYPITTAVIPPPMLRIKDKSMTVPCHPTMEYTLLMPTPKPWKNPKNMQIFGRPNLTVETDNRARRFP